MPKDRIPEVAQRNHEIRIKYAELLSQKYQQSAIFENLARDYNLSRATVENIIYREPESNNSHERKRKATQKPGKMAEMTVAAKYLSEGYDVLIPLNQDCAFDLVVHHEGILQRIQVKTGRRNQSGAIYRPMPTNREYDIYAIVVDGEIFIQPS